MYFIANCFSSKTLGYILTIIVSLFFFAYQVNLMYIPFLVGILTFKFKEILQERALILTIISGTIYAVMFANWSAEMADTPLLRLYQYLNPIRWSEVTQPFIFYIYKVTMGVFGSLFIISLFILLAKHISENSIGKMLGKWGTLTLGVYLWQAVILEHIMMKTLDLSAMEWNLFNYIVSPLISVGVLIVCVTFTQLLKLNKWTSFLFLGTPRPTK